LELTLVGSGLRNTEDMKNAIFWNIMLCSLLKVNQCTKCTKYGRWSFTDKPSKLI
jgi:hypothetical protein